MSFWFVFDPTEPKASPVIRWSGNGWHQGQFELNGKTHFALIADADADGLFTQADSWGLGITEKDLFQFRNSAFRVESHAWLGEAVPFQVVRCDSQGRSVVIRAFDLGMTRKGEEKAKDRYAEDRQFPRSKKKIGFLKSFAEATRISKETEKPLVIDFTTEWCGPCKIMDRLVFTAKPVVDASQQYVFLKLDGDEEKEIVKQYSIQGYPTTLLLSSEGELIRRHIGYLGVKEFLQFMKPSDK